MKKSILFSGILTVLLLMCWSCEPAAPVPQETIAQNAPEPIEAKPADAQPQQPAIEANAPPAKAAEPNEQKTAVIEQATQKPPEVKIAESNALTESKTANELCNKCTDLLSKYVDKDGFLNFRMLARKKLELLEILDSFKTLSRKDYDSWPRNDKIAFWINAYNLELAKIILDNYPIESTRILRLFWPPNSIRHIRGIWDERKFIIMDEEFNLQSIENRYFVTEFDEPGAFLALFYASVSGPPLKNQAYCGRDLSAQLDEQARKFLSMPQNFRINRDTGVVSISSILSPSWQGGKFITKYGTDLKFKNREPAVRAVLNFLIKYIPQADADYLETANYTIEYINYDWTLNDRSGPQS
jgi:hypothetical protein